MELLFNDLSIHGQLSDVPTFKSAVGRIMMIRQLARRFGRELHCHRNVAAARVSQNESMPQAIQWLPINERRALMQWLTQQGPFWEDIRAHDPGDYLECNQTVVTDSAVGEAAYRCFHGLDCHLVSVCPSSWELSPVTVTWFRDADARATIEVSNHWDADEVEAVLQAASVPLGSWQQLRAIAVTRCARLVFSPDAFDSLRGQPFAPGAAQRVLVLLDTLHRLRGCIDENGQRTAEGHRLYQDHFTGDKAWFSDSSPTEQRDFKTELTFHHPTAVDEELFCPWHGKVKNPQLRIHFSWPVGPNEPLCVVYVGPKITKQ
jgi:hypothetical protein